MTKMTLMNYRKSIIHVVLWLTYYTLVSLALSGRFSIEKSMLIAFMTVGSQAVIFYINYLYLVPRFYLNSKYLPYFGFIIILITVEVFFGRFATEEFMLGGRPDRQFPPFGRPPDFNPTRFAIIRTVPFILTAMASILISSILKVSEHAKKKEKETELLKTENLNTELKFLRSQINPHFLFNALNNIYSLSITESKKTPEMVLKLSNILRYLIYECNVDKVALIKEIEYINNYIDLQKLKDDTLDNISFEFQANHQEISPMLLIPFVENAFKHSRIEDARKGWINICLQCSEKGLLQFSVKNSMPPITYEKDDTGGVGIENVKKRLELLYPDKHELNFSQDEKQFEVEMKILLN